MYKSTLRPNEVLGKLLGGLLGVTSERLNAVLDDVGGEEVTDAGCGFIHWSHSCVILDKAVFNLSEEYEKKVLIRRSWINRRIENKQEKEKLNDTYADQRTNKELKNFNNSKEESGVDETYKKVSPLGLFHYVEYSADRSSQI